jgi:hypothetical protein
MCQQSLHEVLVMGLLDYGDIPFIQHNARRERQGLLGSADNQDIFLVAGDPAPTREVVADCPA